MDDNSLNYQGSVLRQYEASNLGDELYMNHQSYHLPYLGTEADPISPTLRPPEGPGGSGSTMSGWLQSWQLDTAAPPSLPAISEFDSSPATPSLPPQDCLHQHQLQCHQQPLTHAQPHPHLLQRIPSGSSLSIDTRLTDPIQHKGMRVDQVMQSVPDDISSAVQLQHHSQSQALNSPILRSPTAENQFVPGGRGSSTSSSIHSKSSASSIELTGEGVGLSPFSTEVSLIQPPALPEGQPGSIYIPSLESFPGDYGFKVVFKNPDTCAYSYSPNSKVLCVNKNVDFAAIFSFTERPRPGFTIRTLVCPKTAQDIQKIGVVKRCVQHVHKDGGSNHFLMCRNRQAVYSECHSHSIISVPLNSMAEYDCSGPTCVYSCSCYSTCVVGKGANRPALVIIFSLIDDSGGSIVGQDVINLRCCACPGRDSGRSKKRRTNTTNPPRKRKKQPKRKNRTTVSLESQVATAVSEAPSAVSSFPRLPSLSSLPAQLNRVKDVQPDEDGFYNFTWRLKDKAMFNMLTVLKEGHTSLQSTT